MVHLICFRLEIPFLGKFGPKNQICQFKLKFATYTNSNIQNSMGMCTFLGFDPKYLFWAYLVKKFIFVCSGKNAEFNDGVLWICLRLEIPFLGTFSPNNENCQF